MENKHIIELLPDYLDNLLDESKKYEVETHLKTCDSCSQELEAMKIMYKAFSDEETVVPSDTVRANFLEQLELEKQTSSKVVSINSELPSRKGSWIPNLLKIAASITLLFGAFMLGKTQQEQKSSNEIALLQNESQGMKQTTMLSLMGNKSASKRIQGVQYIDEFANPDEAIVKALADRMLYDENTNVRLTAVEALRKFIASETVKDTFIKALKTEKDPSIQIEIIGILVVIQEKKAIAPMKDLLEQEDTQPYVKEQLKLVLPNKI